ncbi:putative efflux protein, MATE family [Caldanaerobius fijiensis DSM 17918]|uniref:Probable multidrug resistance protein NorM n=1 Tax=Caldanaerobius fijiensis DSM 17918 TaxID=1121256 RepID=A0A1M5DIZ6_9THEO|nr:MATE family efflux transporter [Caldanaerobius fijiensis]SHF66712.1 putative efflux protein, MATE family [Caldanaerobius fijiensis DSM 17918]
MEISYAKRSTKNEIWQLAWPSIIEQSLIMMVGLVSTMFVGRLGNAAIAAVGAINSLIFFFQAVFAGLSTGSTVIVARLIGEKDHENARLAVMQSLIMCIFIFIMLTVLGYIFAVPLIHLFFGRISADVFRYALLYYRIVLIGLPFVIIDLVIGGALRGAGDTRTPMYITAIVNIISLLFNLLLVFGVKINGTYIVPAYGVKGTAIAVTIARIIGGFLQLYILYFAKRVINLSIKDRIRIDFKMMSRIVRVGLPASLEQLVMQGGFLVVQIMVATMGTVAMAVYQIGMNANSIAFMPIFGFTLAATSLVGRSLGAKEYDAAENYARQTTRIAVKVIAVIGVCMFIFARQLAALYSTDPVVIHMGSVVIRIFAVIEPMLAIMNVISGSLRAGGDILYIVLTAFAGLWTFRVLVGFILGKILGMGVYGIWIGICFDFVVRSCMYWFRFRAGKWKYIKV